MMKTLIAIISLLAIITKTTLALSQCQCTPNSATFPGAVTQSDTISISTQNEIVGTTDIGKLISFGSTTVLQNVAQVTKQSSNVLVHSCPSGYLPFTQEDLDTLIKRPDFTTLINSSNLNLSTTASYFSSTKVYPQIINGGQNEAYEYYSLKFDTQKKPSIASANTYWTDDASRKTICKRVLSSFAISLEGYEGYDLQQGKTYQFKIQNNNVQKYYIEDSNGKTYTTQTFSYTHQGNQQWGCATINFRLQVFGGVIVADCIGIWTKPEFAFNADSTITIDQITKTTLANVKANVNNGMFFSSGSAPIAPIINDSSSVYVFYSEKANSALKVQKLSNLGAPISNPIDIKEIGNPFDIVSTHFGFVIIANDSTQKAWISAYNKDGSLRWKRILVNNGTGPLTSTDEIKFTTNDKCELPFGMNVMYNPHNGRLNYARGRIQAIWAHYNHFGNNANGTKNDHTGDTMISLDADTGYNQKVYWSWGTSHSLYQNLHYDSKYLYVASLGDAYPMNIAFKICDVDLNLQCKSSSTVIPGDIPGNGGGSSSGRQGSFIDIIGSRGEKYFDYQRKACNGGYAGTVSTNTKNEFALIRFDQDLKLISTKIILDGNLASRVNVVKAVKYGKNILIAYNLIPSANVSNFNYQDVKQATDEAYLTLLSGVDGSTIYGPTKFTSYQINSSDDWRVLEDGRIAYTIVDSNNNLNFYYTPALTPPQYPNLIQSTDIIYGFKNLVNTKISLVKNNYNDICIKQGDSNYSVSDTVLTNNKKM